MSEKDESLNYARKLAALIREIRAKGIVFSGDDEYCAGGDSECPIFGVQLVEAVEAWSG